MTYYKVKPEYDNRCYYRTLGRTHKRTLAGFLIANELLTEKERNKITVSDEYFTIVNINPHRTYFFFGARFEM